MRLVFEALIRFLKIAGLVAAELVGKSPGQNEGKFQAAMGVLGNRFSSWNS